MIPDPANRSIRTLFGRKQGPAGAPIKMDQPEPLTKPKSAIPLPGATKPLQWPSMSKQKVTP